MGDEGSGGAAVEHVALVVAKRGVAQVRPAEAVFPVRGGVGQRAGATAIIGAAAVVAEKHYEGVLVLPELFEARHDAADGLIQAVHHRGEDRHAEVLEIFFFFRERVPRGNRVGPRRERPLGTQQAGLHHARVPLLAQAIPAGAIFAPIFRDVLGPRLQGAVRGVERKIHEEGFLRILLPTVELHVIRQ